MEAAPEYADYAEHPELALVALMHLLTRYASTRNPRLAEAAVTQLRTIAHDARLAGAVRQCAGQLIGDWQRFGCPCRSTDPLH